MKKFLWCIPLIFIMYLYFGLNVNGITYDSDFESYSLNSQNIIVIDGMEYTIIEEIIGISLSEGDEFFNAKDENDDLYIIRNLPYYDDGVMHDAYSLCFDYSLYDFDPWELSREYSHYSYFKKVVCKKSPSSEGDIYGFYYYIDSEHLFKTARLSLSTQRVTYYYQKMVVTQTLLEQQQLHLTNTYANINEIDEKYEYYTGNSIDNSFYFENLVNNFGNNVNGTCTYISLQMMLSYYDCLYDDNVILENYDENESFNNYLIENFENSPGSKESFHSYLQSLYVDPNNGTALAFSNVENLYNAYKNAVGTIDNYVYNDYVYSPNYGQSSTMEYIGTINDFELSVKEQLDNGFPVLLMVNSWNLYQYNFNDSHGTLEFSELSQYNNNGHALVAYGYYEINDELYFRVNCGWKNSGYEDSLLKVVGIAAYATIKNSNFARSYEKANNYYFVNNDVETPIIFNSIPNQTSVALTGQISRFMFHTANSFSDGLYFDKIIINSSSGYDIYINGERVTADIEELTRKEYIIYSETYYSISITIVLTDVSYSSGSYIYVDGRYEVVVSEARINYKVFSTLDDDCITNDVIVSFDYSDIDYVNKTVTFSKILMAKEVLPGTNEYYLTDYGIIFICGTEYNSVANGYYTYLFSDHYIETQTQGYINVFMCEIENLTITFTDAEFNNFLVRM